MKDTPTPASSSEPLKPSGYSIDAKLPSVEVTKEFLKDLELYILAKAREHSVHDPAQLQENYSVMIEDSMGNNGLSSISDFPYATYPNDTKRISLAYQCCCFSLSIRLGLDSAQVRSALRKIGAKEAVQGIHSELLRIFRQYENRNWIFHISGVEGAVWTATFLSGLAVFSSLQKYTAPAAILGATYLVSTYLKPYCVFPTRQNASRQYWYRWFIGAALAFLIFTVVGVYLRKQLLGF